ncbi:zinc finger protein ZAT12-like [Ipomoea triloba]|uniref:zinc finger protein ZAT12-like n=1 Tax=Ipomoea triloba TaxID=35885 RepID=UPI00125E1088|nr:zinc finger protein ZAT12-like [Ipomoea triloba]
MAVLKRSNRDDDVESLAMANCVMLISRMDEEQIAMSGRVYECKTCRKKFHSFQALGGHRASHKRPRMPSEKKHVCTVCGLEFERGQALGGHMNNLHSDSKVVVKEQQEEKEEDSSPDSIKVVVSWDLNLTPHENETTELILAAEIRLN